MPTANNIIVGGARVFLGPADADGVGYTDDATLFTVSAALMPVGVSCITGFSGGNVAHGLAAYATSGFKEVGFTSDGFDLSFEPEFNDVEVDQLLDSAILFKTKQKVNAKTSLTEATLVNLARAIGQKDTEGVSASDGVVVAGASVPGTWNEVGDTKTLGITGGALGSFPQEKTLVAVANGPRSVAGKTVERVFEAYRAISVESVGIAVKRNEVTSFPVSFRCLPGTNGRYMKIADRVYG
jgi:stage V sporulation protein SpoVS